MGFSRLRVSKRAIALLVSVATLFGVVGVAVSQPANALPTLQSPNGKLLPDKPLEGPLDALGTTVESVQQTIAAVQAALDALILSVQGDGTPAKPGLIAQLQEFIAEAQADPANAATNLQAFITGTVVPPLESTALNQALALAAKIASPICPVIGAAASLQNVALPTIPDYSIFGELAPFVKKTDQNTATRIRNYYIFAMASLLSPVALPAAAAAASPYVALAQVLLQLIAVNWHTTYYPPVEDPAHPPAPVVKDTPGYLFLPSLLDVDGNIGFDICANQGLDLTTLGINQQIDRIPTSDPNMRYDIEAQAVFGVLHTGYRVPAGSTLPAMFDTTLAGGTGYPFQTKTHVVGKALSQYHSLAGAIDYTVDTQKTPTLYKVTSVKPGGTSGNGTQINWTASGDGKAFSTYTKLGSLLLNGINAQNPAPDHFEYCTSAKGFCSNAPAADTAVETQSIHITAQKPTEINIFNSEAGRTATTCPGLAILGDGHLKGQRFFLGAKTSSTATVEGHAWADTDDLPISGCLAAASTTATLPTGFKAQNRRVTFLGTGTAPATSKTGTINCPAAIPAAPPLPAVPGTSITGGSAGLTFGLSRYLCSFPPLNTVAPTITGQNFKASTLTANKGTWTPAAPNTPTFTYQWLRCDTAGANCAPIAGATNATYTNTDDDLGGHTIRVVVTGTNLDGTLSVTSAQTLVITLPPAPVNTVLPAISGIVGTGNELTASTGTWINAPTTYAFQWRLCDAAGNACANIGGANTNKYTPSLSDQGHQLRVVVTASNIGGANSATSNGVYVPPPPTNLTLPIIKNGNSPAAGSNVFEGDHLSVTNGTWTDGQTFTYQWQICDNSPSLTCTPIAGATHAAYQASHDDIGHMLNAIVTAKNPDGELAATAAETGLVLANALLPKTPGNVPDGKVLATADSGRESAFIGGAFDTVGPLVGGGGSLPATPAAISKNATLKALVNSGGKVNAVASDTAGGYFIGGDFTSVLGLPCNAVAHVKLDGSLDATYCQASPFTGEVRALSYAKRSVTIGVSSPINLLVVGGEFTRADGRKNLAIIDQTGFTSFMSADPDGAVNAIADDTSAGRPNYLIGGAFDNAGGVAVKKMGLLTLTSPPPTDGTAVNNGFGAYPGGVACEPGGCATPVVKALQFVNASLPHFIVGGTFDRAIGTGTTASSQLRHNLASFAEVASPNQTVGAWNPNPNGTTINALASQGGTVYIAGDFTQLQSTATTPVVTTGYKGLAEYGITGGLTSLSPLLWTSTGNAAGTGATSSPNTAWKPQIDTGAVLSIVSEPTVANGVYVAGSFTSIGGTVRHRLANISGPSAVAASLNAWDPNAGQTVRAITRFAGLAAVSPNPAVPAAVFAAGDYKVLGGETHLNVAELKPDGSIGPWNPTGTNGDVKAIAVKGGIAYVGGNFSTAAGAVRHNLAAYDANLGGAQGWDPNADGVVNVIKSSPGGIYVGGAFNNVGGATRPNLAELDAAGVASGWNPGTDGTVNALAVASGVVYAGGAFANAAGGPHSNAVAVDGVTGSPVAVALDTNGPVNAIVVNADGAYIGGSFSTVNGIARSNIGLVDLTTVPGDVLSYAPEADGAVRALLIVGAKVFAGGDFLNIGGQSRSHAAQLETDGTATGFLPEPNGTVYSLYSSPGGLFGIFGNFSLLSGGVPTQGVAFYGG